MKAHVPLHQRVALFRILHLPHDLGKILLGAHHHVGRVVFGIPVNADLVADLSAQHLVHRQAGHLPREVPEGNLNGADRRTPGLEGSHRADVHHDARDISGVLAHKIFFVEQHHGLQIRLHRLRLAVTGNALVGNNSNRGVPSDDGAFKIRDLDLDRAGLRRCLRERPPGARPSAQRGCRRRS